MTTVPRLGHVILYVSDLDASVRIYRDVAGLPHRSTDAGYAEFGTGATRADRAGEIGRRVGALPAARSAELIVRAVPAPETGQ